MTNTHQIISMTAGKTSGSGRPMWRCDTLDGQHVNAFRHADPSRNSYAFFSAAGYGAEMLALGQDESLVWDTFPIGVTLVKSYDGKWWNIVAVEPRPDGAIPDPQFIPNHALVQRYVYEWASLVTSSVDLVVWDTETTGVGKDAEIVSIGVVSPLGGVYMDRFIRPEKPEKLVLNGSGAINGITPKILEYAPTFPEVYEEILGALADRSWVIFNADFDAPLLERTCLKYGLMPPPTLGVTCAMEMYARWHGEWNRARQCYTPKGLQFARKQFGIPEDEAHTAIGDARTTLRMIETLAALEVQS